MLFVVFNVALGGTATFKQLFAVFVHSTAITVVQQLFVTPLNYVRESISSATNLAVFLPMLDEGSFLAKLLGTIDLVPDLVDRRPVDRPRRAVQAQDRADRGRAVRSLRRHRRHRRGVLWSRGSVSVNRKKLIIGALIVVLGGALVAANVYFKREKGVEVQVEKIKKHDLESIVSASGKIQARTTVNISAQSMGRVTRLAVEEGDRVKEGQFLLEIDPRSLRTQVERSEAGLVGAAHGRRPGPRPARVRQVLPEAGAGHLQAPAGPLEGPADDEARPSTGPRTTSSCASGTSRPARRPSRWSRPASARTTADLDNARYNLGQVSHRLAD